jgi:signal transduction histidine kinase
VRLERLLTSATLRLAAIQTVLLIAAFLVAGTLTKLSVKYVYGHDVRARVAAQAATLAVRYRSGGVVAVASAVNDAEGRPGGLEFRLVDSKGQRLAGDLPPTGAALGWTSLDWDDAVVPGRPFQDLLVFTQQLPDGSVLTVGQDLSAESRLRHILKGTLFWCGAAGAVVGLGLSYLVGGGALRRIEGVVNAARAVSAGQMQVRAPQRTTLAPDDIDILGSNFNAMLDQIAKLIERVRWVSTDIAHDLRTPLTHVRQKLEALKASAGADEACLAAAGEIETDVDELLRIFDAMLRLSEIECDRSTARFQRVDIADVGARIADAYAPDVEASCRSLTTHLAPAAVYGDSDLIAQALSNLVENGLRHTPPGSRIVISSGVRDGRPWLSVVDDGPGIPPDRRDDVLRHFYRLEISRTTPGSGLGLAIVSAIASLHGAALVLCDADPGLSVTLRFAPAPTGHRRQAV